MNNESSTPTLFRADDIHAAIEAAKLDGADLDASVREKCLEYGLDFRELAEATIETTEGDIPMAAMLGCGIVAGLALAVSYGYVPSDESQGP